MSTPPEEDRATTMDNTHKNGEDRTCSSENMIVDRQTHTHTDTQTDTLITILRSPIGRGVTSCVMIHTRAKIKFIGCLVGWFKRQNGNGRTDEHDRSLYQ